MSRSNKPIVPEAKYALDEFKEEIAQEMGISFSNNDQGYKGDISAYQAGTLANMSNGKNIGGQMVKKMIENAEMEMIKNNKNN
ncbi:MAG TPA: hypothetical protein DEP72_04870 [Clostridiales bacterium]|nr:MAG: hypothetical protein A2Y18_01975 [Clostridiales bacterium GWD2_32_19]HCC07472.1 hypothetical protein [Clostridiales bacterium]